MIREAWATFRVWARSGRLIGWLSGSGCCTRGSRCSLWCASARPLAVDLSFTLAAVTAAIVVVATLIPVSIGGLGIREGGFVLLLGEAGIDASGRHGDLAAQRRRHPDLERGGRGAHRGLRRPHARDEGAPRTAPAVRLGAAVISVIIPVKDGGADLRRCLDGIARQRTDEEVEVVVVDSGSGRQPRARRSPGAT